jgi:hypothetical protein
MIKSCFKFSLNSISLLSFTKKCNLKKTYMYKETGYAHGRKFYMNVNIIDFMTFVTCYMMTKKKLYDKEQIFIWILKCFIGLRIMKNQYVNWVNNINSVNFNYTLYIGLLIAGMTAVSISSDILVFFFKYLNLAIQ